MPTAGGRQDTLPRHLSEQINGVTQSLQYGSVKPKAKSGYALTSIHNTRWNI